MAASVDVERSSLPTPSAERRRVRAHLRRAELSARASAPPTDPLVDLVRSLLLGELAAYRARGLFPRNPRRSRTPIFVDAAGTRCAMGHLLEVGGEHALVSKITIERNLAYVRELADEPRLVAWLAAAGISVAEAAAIQPTYCQTNSECVCGGRSYVPYPVPARGVLDGTVLSQDPVDGLSMVRIGSIHGESLGYQTGDTVIAYVGNPTPGDRALVPVTRPAGSGEGEGMLGGVTLDSAGAYTCQSLGVRARPVDAEDFVAAVTVDDCDASLAAVSDEWARNSCDEGGCAAGGHAPSTLGILLAVVSVLAARTLRRRPPRPSSHEGA